jgi:nicotinate-nucleotide pyrophosphorylase (carboxylating)
MIDNQIWLDKIIQSALEEDLGAGDLTTDAIISPDTAGKAVLEAREEIVLAGLYVFKKVFQKIDNTVEVESFFEDGQIVPSGKNICIVSGSLSAILKAERTALNFIQRMSGIATQTRIYVDSIGPEKARILDTRKTAPGLRFLDKYAVTMGGGANHRLGLFDGILIKDNHIKAAGSIFRAVMLAKEKAPHTIKVEVEVEDLSGLMEAVKAGADMILLDNMDPAMMKEAVGLTKGKVLLEASGGITLNNIKAVAESGVDLISIGALTHSVRAVDLSLEIIES